MKNKFVSKKFLNLVTLFFVVSGLIFAIFSNANIVHAIPLDSPENQGIMGSGTELDPYILSEQEHLMYVNTQSAAYIADNNVGKGNSSYYKLANDIVIDDSVFWTIKDGIFSPNWLGGIGRLRPFRGTFDGDNNKIIFNITNKRPSSSFPNAIDYGTNFALFGTLARATVKNLTVEGDITLAGAGFYIAGIASQVIEGSTISDCTNNLNITLYGVNTSRPSGVASIVKGSTISNCVNNGDITMFNENTNYVGGVVTELFESSKIENSYNTGAITVNQLNEPDKDKSFRSVMGGVVGTISASTATNVYNTGAVTLNGNRHNDQPSTVLSSLGGVAGIADSPDSRIITGCYNTGAITSYNANVGGIVGFASGVSIRSSYNTGTVTGLNAGGIVGSIATKASEVLLTFNTGDIKGKSTKNGSELGINGGGLVGIISTTAKVKASYSLGKIVNFSEPAILISKFTAPVVLDGLYGYSSVGTNSNLTLIRTYGGKNMEGVTDGSKFMMTLSPSPVITNLYTFTDDNMGQHFYKLNNHNYISSDQAANTYIFHSEAATGDLNLYSSLDTARYRMLKSRVSEEALSLNELDMNYDLWLKGKNATNKMTIKFAKPFTYNLVSRDKEFDFLSFKDYKLKVGDENYDPTDHYLYALNLEDEFKEKIVAPGSIGDHTVYFKATKIVNKGTIDEGTVEIKREINYTITRATVNRPTNLTITYNGTAQSGVDTSSSLSLWKQQWANHYDEMRELYGDSENNPIPEAIAYEFLDGNKVGTNASIYQTIYKLNDSFIWDNNALYDTSVSWSIGKLAIEAPKASDKQLKKGQEVTGIDDYGEILGVNLNNLTAEERNAYYIILGDINGSNVGTYYTNITPTLNFKWSHQESNLLTLTWKITPLGIEKVIKNDNHITFNGSEQIGLDNFDPTMLGKAYTISGKYAATNAGNYLVTVRLTPDFMWSDGSTEEISFEWTINKYAVAKPNANNKLVFNTLAQNGVNSESASGTIKNTSYNYTNAYKIAISNSNIKINAGTYNAVYSLTNNYCWEDGTTEDEVITYTIAPFKVTMPTANTFTYDGEAKIGTLTEYNVVVINNEVTVRTLINGNEVILFKLSSGKYEQINAGNYTTSWSLDNRINYVWDNFDLDSSPLSLNWTIGRMVVPTNSLPVKDTSIGEYNERNQAGIQFDNSEIFYKWRGQTSATNSGDYQAVFNLTSNYCWSVNDGIEDTSEKIIEWSIAKKKIDRPVKNSATLTYQQGFNQKGVLNIPQSGVTVSGTTNSINANNYVATFMLLNFNYEWSTPNEDLVYDDMITIPWQIQRKLVEKPTANNIYYTGEIITGILFDESLVGEAYTYTGSIKSTNIGTYVGYFTLTNNYQWDDYSIEPTEIFWTIIGISVDRPTIKTGLEYNGNDQLGIVLPENWEKFYTVINGSILSKNAGVYSVLFGLKDGIVWNGDAVDERNSYYLTYTIAKKNISEDLSLTIGPDQDHNILGDIVEDYGAPVITYSTDNGATWSTAKPEKQSYAIRAFFAATDNYSAITLTSFYEYIAPPNYFLIVTSILFMIGLIVLITLLLIKQRKNSIRIRKLQEALSISDEQNNGLLIDQV